MAQRKVFGRVRTLTKDDVWIFEMTKGGIGFRKFRSRKRKHKLTFAQILDAIEGQLQLPI